MRKYEIRKLTKTVKNPMRDKRRSYGIESRDEFAEGTAFAVRCYEDQLNELRFIGNARSHSVPRYGEPKLFLELMENSEPIEPRTPAEALASLGYDYDWAAGNVLDVMFRDGDIAMADIESTIHKIDAEFD